MDTKERKTHGARHRSGALFALPSPTWRPAPPESGKNPIRKAAFSFKGGCKNFGLVCPGYSGPHRNRVRSICPSSARRAIHDEPTQCGHWSLGYQTGMEARCTLFERYKFLDPGEGSGRPENGAIPARSLAAGAEPPPGSGTGWARSPCRQLPRQKLSPPVRAIRSEGPSL